jgi:hypothetical protein
MIKLKDILVEADIIKKEAIGDIPPAHIRQTEKPNKQNTPFVSKDKSVSKKIPIISDSALIDAAANIISKFENNPNFKKSGFDKSKGRWFPHKSIEGGADTIAYGHKILPSEDFSKGLTEAEAQALLKKDIAKKLIEARRLIKNFDSLPSQVKIASLNGLFRGDLGPKTMSLLSQNKFAEAAIEYLDHREYLSTKSSGIKSRMEYNAELIKTAKRT